jgi:regulator of protease activity HflC (stomatin/prohibitin superfamily)
MLPAIFTLIVLIGIVLLISIRQIDQYERGVKFTMGRFTSIQNPGWRLVIPIFQSMKKVDMRTKAVDVPDQESLTKDNVSVRVNAVIYYSIEAADKAILAVENYWYAVSQLAQTTMRNIVGEVTLDELLAQREQISNRIKEIVDSTAAGWGVNVSGVELKQVEVPETMKRTMAKQAEAEREKRATIINSEAEVASAQNLNKAATILAQAPGALHLRTLNSINDISSDDSNTVVFMLPMEVLKAVEGFGEAAKKFVGKS